ncbi:MAG: Crp/Fnr family transcriptional regulator [Burkholderiaceae bacterium]
MTEDNTKLLAKCQLFSGIDEDALGDLASRAYRQRYIAGEQIFQIGSPGQSLMAVSSGTVRITFPSAKGKEIILSDLTDGEVFGEMSLLDGSERSADAIALTNCELMILERRDVVPFLEKNPHICLKLLNVLCGRLRRANELMADIAFYDLPMRLAKTMMRLAMGSTSVIGSAGMKTKLSCSQLELANMIGASRENVNRCLNDWQRRGIVNLEDGWIYLVMPDALEKLAAS